MSHLTVYADAETPRVVRETADRAAIAGELDAIGVLFEQWEAAVPLADDASQDDVITAYRQPIDRLMNAYGFESVDVVNMVPDHPQRDEFRAKFLDEHTHSDFEVRFFVDGAGMFYIHHQDQVFAIECTRGDLISVPADTTHWFDMGPCPFFKAIRLFTTPEGWVADFTGSPIAKRYPEYAGAGAGVADD